MNESNDNVKFLNDVNSSAYIDEIQRVQDSPYYSPLKLQQQGQKFKEFQESGRYTDTFVGDYLKDNGLYYLTDTQDIMITKR